MPTTPSGGGGANNPAPAAPGRTYASTSNPSPPVQAGWAVAGSMPAVSSLADGRVMVGSGPGGLEGVPWLTVDRATGAVQALADRSPSDPPVYGNRVCFPIITKPSNPAYQKYGLGIFQGRDGDCANLFLYGNEGRDDEEYAQALISSAGEYNQLEFDYHAADGSWLSPFILSTAAGPGVNVAGVEDGGYCTWAIPATRFTAYRTLRPAPTRFGVRYGADDSMEARGTVAEFNAEVPGWAGALGDSAAGGNVQFGVLEIGGGDDPATHMHRRMGRLSWDLASFIDAGDFDSRVRLTNSGSASLLIASAESTLSSGGSSILGVGPSGLRFGHDPGAGYVEYDVLRPDVSRLAATGTPGAGNFLRGDGTWATDLPALALTADTGTEAMSVAAGAHIAFDGPGGVRKLYASGSNLVYVGGISVGVQAVSCASVYPGGTAALNLRGRVTDGSTAIGIKVGAVNALSTAGAKVVAFYKDDVTTEVASINQAGTIASLAPSGGTAFSALTGARLYLSTATYLQSDNSWVSVQGATGFSCSGRMSAGSFRASGSTGAVFYGRAANSGSPVAHTFGNEATLDVAGAKIASFIPGSSGGEVASIGVDGSFLSAGNPLGRKVAVPATATSAGALGDFAADASYLYVCTAANVWKRTAVATF